MNNKDSIVREMPNTLIIIISITVLVLILYLANVKLEFSLKKIDNNSTGETDKAGLDKLSNTEIKILKLVSEGKSNQDIADELHISVHTVKKHISNIFKKLRLNSRAQARKYKDQLK